MRKWSELVIKRFAKFENNICLNIVVIENKMSFLKTLSKLVYDYSIV